MRPSQDCLEVTLLPLVPSARVRLRRYGSPVAGRGHVVEVAAEDGERPFLRGYPPRQAVAEVRAEGGERRHSV
eukprot:2863230-Pyramimonas_sp.AAC.1